MSQSVSQPPWRAATRPTAVLGGTFDPVHNAHLAIAAHALAALDAARVLWMPTGAPAYRRAPIAAPEHRLRMLKLATAAESRYAVDTREFAPTHSGYTVDTLTSLAAELGDASPLVLLIGADQFAQLRSWHRWQDLFSLCRIAVFNRPGERAARIDAPAGRMVQIAMEPSTISASDIRARIARGEDVSAMVPGPVLNYIQQHRLYQQ